MKGIKEPLVSLITIDYNSPRCTMELLDSLTKSKYKNWELIIVDNGTTEEAGQKLQHLSQNVRYFKTEENLGFSGGNNFGYDRAKGDFIFFINNDTEVSSELISKLVQRLEGNSRIGLVSPKIKYFDTNIIQYAGYTPLTILMRNKAIGSMQVDDGTYESFIRTPYAHGAAMMTRRDVIESAGTMPEFFFLYYEEMDWSERIKRANFEIWVDQSAIIFHKESMSIGKSNPLKTYYLTRNRILFSRRNNSFLVNTLFILYTFTIVFPFKSLIYFFKKDWRQLISFGRAHYWHLVNSIWK